MVARGAIYICRFVDGLSVWVLQETSDRSTSHSLSKLYAIPTNTTAAT